MKIGDFWRKLIWQHAIFLALWGLIGYLSLPDPKNPPPPFKAYTDFLADYGLHLILFSAISEIVRGYVKK